MSSPPLPITQTSTPQAQPQQSPSLPLALVVSAGVLLPLALAYALATGSELRVFAGIMGALTIALIVWQPFWGLVFFIGLIYLRLEELIPGLAGMRLTLILSLATLVGMGLQHLVRKQPLVRHPIVAMIVGFAATASVSGVLTGYAAGAVEQMAKLALMAILVLNLVRTPDRYRIFVTALILFTTYLAAFSIFRYFAGEALNEHGTLRSQLTGIFSDPNDLAAGVVFGLALALARIPNSRWVGKCLYALACSVMATAILLTHSRGGLLAMAVVVFVYFVSTLKNKGVAVLAGVLALGLLLVAAPGRMRSFDSQEESANTRFELWLDGLEELKSNPILGMGFRQFAEQNPTGLTAHNSFVLAFSELGFTGYFFWMGCLYYAFRRPREDGESRALEPSVERDLFGARLALAGFLVAAFFLSRTYVQVTWLFIALTAAAQYVTGAGSDNFRFQPKEQSRDWGRILGLCLAGLLVIKIIAHLLA